MKIMANSLPKSGTHLLIKLLKELNFERKQPGLSAAMIRMTQRNPFRRLSTFVKKCSCNSSNGEHFKIDLDNLDNCIKKKHLDKYLLSIDENQFISAHVPYTLELDNYLSLHNIKMIYIIRDPRAVLLSYYNHQSTDKNYDLYYFFKNKTLEESYLPILNGIKGNGDIVLTSLKERVNNSKGWINSANVCAIHFETLIGSKGGGCAVTQQNEIKKILKYLSGSSYKNFDIDNLANKIFDTKAPTFKNGQIDKWKTTLSEVMIKKVEEKLATEIEELGYELVYKQNT